MIFELSSLHLRSRNVWEILTVSSRIFVKRASASSPVSSRRSLEHILIERISCLVRGALLLVSSSRLSRNLGERADRCLATCTLFDRSNCQTFNSKSVPRMKHFHDW